MLSPTEAALHPMNSRETWVDIDGDLQPASAPRFDAIGKRPGPIPMRDQHRDEILQDLAVRHAASVT